MPMAMVATSSSSASIATHRDSCVARRSSTRRTYSGNVNGIEADEKGVIFLSLCLGDQCSLEGEPKQVRTQIYASRDGGVTWNEEAELDGEWWVRGAANGTALAINFAGDNPTWKLLPANVPVSPPPGAAPCCQAFGISGAFAWSAQNANALIAADGARLSRFSAPPGPGSPRVSSALVVGSNLAVTWSSPATSETFLGLFDTSGSEVGQPVRVPPGLDLRTPFDNSLFIATVDYKRPAEERCGGTAYGADPVIVDLNADTYAFIHDPFYDPACSHGTQRVITAFPGTARVNTPGDCLNVHDGISTSAPIITCLRDGVLVRVLGRPPADPPPPDYDSWIAVQLPDGRRGWVRKAYLEQ